MLACFLALLESKLSQFEASRFFVSRWTFWPNFESFVFLECFLMVILFYPIWCNWYNHMHDAFGGRMLLCNIGLSILALGAGFHCLCARQRHYPVGLFTATLHYYPMFAWLKNVYFGEVNKSFAGRCTMNSGPRLLVPSSYKLLTRATRSYTPGFHDDHLSELCLVSFWTNVIKSRKTRGIVH